MRELGFVALERARSYFSRNSSAPSCSRRRPRVIQLVFSRTVLMLAASRVLASRPTSVTERLKPARLLVEALVERERVWKDAARRSAEARELEAVATAEVAARVCFAAPPWVASWRLLEDLWESSSTASGPTLLVCVV